MGGGGGGGTVGLGGRLGSCLECICLRVYEYVNAIRKFCCYFSFLRCKKCF